PYTCLSNGHAEIDNAGLNMMQPMDLTELIGYVRGQRDGVVSTLGLDGAPQAAYLSVATTGRGELVFDARPWSRTASNIRRDARVAVVIGGADGTTLQCEGEADLPEGEELERCAAAYVSAFPQFADSLSSGVVVIRVRLSWARYGDFRGEAAEVRDVDLGT
ncbi:pyridoxamine 5'-phosphate oxidase family protein, partial [Kitasatospora herbaricolor]|uniref:pyridoxamine 5'-phosphate oxidase family protein n=1 Tax=Kitasatospora herbaricolor TaxID=68217 RepID=UPI0036D7F9D9